MGALAELRSLSAKQRAVVVASFLGWTLDAFDFFILTFINTHIADDFKTSTTNVLYGISLTLAMRPVGAFLFGYLADRFGRRPVLMLDILLFSAFELGSAFAPNLTVLLVTRAFFGVAMGGEWGIGSSLAMESIPASARGIVSGLLQEGYAVGYLIAAIVYWAFIGLVGWRGIFVIGALPALLVIYVRMGVDESPVWLQQKHSVSGMLDAVKANWKLFLYIILVMSCFNAFSHGTQDLYPNFLKKQHHFSVGMASLVTIIANVGAICGGLFFGAWSERVGRRRAIVTAALLALPIIPLWAFSTTTLFLALGAFLIQISVQGAWGIIPAHLNEMSPAQVRGTFPGFTYQLGNFVISLLAPLQSAIAEHRGNDYGFALAVTAAVVSVLIALVVGFGIERKGMALTAAVPLAHSLEA